MKLLILLLLLCIPANATIRETTIVVYGDYFYRSMFDTPYYGTMESNPMIVRSLLEDINRDNEVDFTDINLVRAAYGSFPGDETWDARCDFDGNGEIDMNDVNVVRAAYGEILE